MTHCILCESASHISCSVLKEKDWAILSPLSSLGPHHVILVPTKHVDSFAKLSYEEFISFQKMLRHCQCVFKQHHPSLAHHQLVSETPGLHLQIHLVPAYSTLKAEAIGRVLLNASDWKKHTPPHALKESFRHAAQSLSEKALEDHLHSWQRLATSNPSFISQAILFRLQVLMARIQTSEAKAILDSWIASHLKLDPPEFSVSYLVLNRVDQALGSTIAPYDSLRDRYARPTPYPFNQLHLGNGTPTNFSCIRFPSKGTPYPASPIHSYAFSAPIPSFFAETFQALFEQKISLVVNLTPFEVKSQIFADPYFPTLPGQEAVYGGCTVRCLRKETLSLPSLWSAEKAVCELEILGKIHQCTYLHVQDWPDGTEGDLLAIDRLIRTIRKHQQELPPQKPKSPIAIHCSAGVGRTGVLIGGLQIYELIDQGKTPDIGEIAFAMRAQRLGLGGTEGQYRRLQELKEHFTQK